MANLILIVDPGDGDRPCGKIQDVVDGRVADRRN